MEGIEHEINPSILGWVPRRLEPGATVYVEVGAGVWMGCENTGLNFPAPLYDGCMVRVKLIYLTSDSRKFLPLMLIDNLFPRVSATDLSCLRRGPMNKWGSLFYKAEELNLAP